MSGDVKQSRSYQRRDTFEGQQLSGSEGQHGHWPWDGCRVLGFVLLKRGKFANRWVTDGDDKNNFKKIEVCRFVIVDSQNSLLCGTYSFLWVEFFFKFGRIFSFGLF